MQSTGEFLAAADSAGVLVFARFLPTDMAALIAELTATFQRSYTEKNASTPALVTNSSE